MATIKFIRGNSQQNDSYTGDANSVSVDTDKKSLRVHDGITPGGSLLATESAMNEKADKSITISAGDGLTGGGSLGNNIVINVGTPSTITGSSVNSSSADSHTHAISVSKADVGLSNVDNTSDLNKPVSTATQTALNAKLNTSAVGNTVASLVGGKVPLSQINDSIIGQVEYMGVWNASTNTPTLPATPTEKGHYYVTSVAGTFQGVPYAVGDWIISNGVSWDKVDNTDAVSSVAGKTGAVSLVKADVGLANVDNTSDLNKPVSTATQTALNLKANLNSPAFTGTPTVPTQNVSDNSTKVASTEFVKNVVAAHDIGVSSITGTSPIQVSGSSSVPDISISNATTSVSGAMSAADKTKLDGIAAGAQVNSVTSVAGKTGAVLLVKADVGLSNVDNTSDLNKPVSTATQTALNLKANLASPVFTGAPKAPTPSVDDNSTNIATTAHVKNVVNTVNTGVVSVTGDAPVTITGTSSNPVIGVNNATTSVSGAMSAADKAKLDGIAAGAQVNTVTSVSGKTGAVTLAKTDVGLSNVDNTSDATKSIGGNAATATKLATSRTISATGDATWSASFDGSANATGALTLANSGVTAGTYPKVTVDAKGRVTAGTSMVAADVPALDASKITTGTFADARMPSRLGAAGAIVTDWNDAVTNGTFMGSEAANAPASGWFIGQVENHGGSGWRTQTLHSFTEGAAADTKTWRRSQTNGTWQAWYRLRISEAEQSAIYLDASKLNAGVLPDARLSGTYTGVNITGNAATATKLQTARSIALTGSVTGSATFDGSANVTITATAAVATPSTDGFMSAADKTKLDSLSAASGISEDDAIVLALIFG